MDVLKAKRNVTHHFLCCASVCVLVHEEMLLKPQVCNVLWVEKSISNLTNTIGHFLFVHDYTIPWYVSITQDTSIIYDK